MLFQKKASVRYISNNNNIYNSERTKTSRVIAFIFYYNTKIFCYFKFTSFNFLMIVFKINSSSKDFGQYVL